MPFAFKTSQAPGRFQHICRAAEVKSEATDTEKPEGGTAKGTVFEVELTKPLGLRYTRGSDGGAYIMNSDPNLGNTDDRIQPGDKILKVSASFGTDIWDAINYGQVMYAIRTRNGGVYLKLQSNGGDTTVMQEKDSDSAKQWKQERSGGDYGAGTKEMQTKNYISRKETERKRRELFDDALEKFQKKDIEGALVDFEEVLGLEPAGYLGDNFSRHTQLYQVSQYNVACCYSALDQVDAGLEALDSAMKTGFQQFDKIRSDPNLENLRKDEARFKETVEKYDEDSLQFNFGGFKKMFGIGRKVDKSKDKQ